MAIFGRPLMLWGGDHVHEGKKGRIVIAAYTRFAACAFFKMEANMFTRTYGEIEKSFEIEMANEEGAWFSSAAIHTKDSYRKII